MLFIKELRPSLLICMKTMNARMFSLFYFVPSDDLKEYFLDYYVGENIETSNSDTIG